MTSSATPQGKGIHGAIKHLLEEQYAFVGGDRVQDMLIEDIDPDFSAIFARPVEFRSRADIMVRRPYG